MKTIQSILMVSILAVLVVFTTQCKKDDAGSEDKDKEIVDPYPGTYLSIARSTGSHTEGVTKCPQLIGITQIASSKTGETTVTADSFAIISNFNGVVFEVDGVSRKNGNLKVARKISAIFDCNNRSSIDYDNIIELYKDGKKVHEDTYKTVITYRK